MALVVKNLPASAGDLRDKGLIPGLGRSPGGGHSSPLHYSCLEKPMDRGASGLQSLGSQSQTGLKQVSTYSGLVQSLSYVRLFATRWTPGFPVLHYLLEFAPTHVH